MPNANQESIEQALTQTETDTIATLKAADVMTKNLRKLRGAAKSGNLRELRSSIDAAEKALAALRQQFSNAKEGWAFDEEGYLADGRYFKEVLATAERMGVRMFERDDRIYSYPSLVRVSASEKSVLIDKKRESRIRPSVLVSILRDVQRKPPRFKYQQFLDALYTTYLKVLAIRGMDYSHAPVIPLVDIHELLTLLPGQAREYTKQEFARDIYLLHRSGVESSKNAKISFPISRGAPGRILTIIDEAGEEKRYYGICFTPMNEER